MKIRLLSLIAIAASVAALPAHAKDDEHKTTLSPNRLGECSHADKGLKGEEHDKFLSQCLKGAHADKPVKEAHNDAGAHTQQNKMKSCNEEAGRKALKGDERKAFMSHCLKG